MFVPRYDEQQARAAIAASTSWTEALRRLGLRAAGGNFRLLKRWAADWGIDSSHFRPFAHAAEHLWREPIPLEDILVEHSSYGRASLKKRLYDEGLKARRCELCGLAEVWRGQPLTLILITSTVSTTTTGWRTSGSSAPTAPPRLRRTARATFR